MNQSEDNNQTQFAFEEPIFSDTNVDIPVDEKIDLEKDKHIKEKKKKKLIIIFGISIFVLFLILIVVLVKSKKQPKLEVPKESPAEVIEDLSAFEIRINNVKEDLDNADPSNQDLTFPPVDMKLRLDKKER